jgi:hypothetical protein
MADCLTEILTAGRQGPLLELDTLVGIQVNCQQFDFATRTKTNNAVLGQVSLSSPYKLSSARPGNSSLVAATTPPRDP